MQPIAGFRWGLLGLILWILPSGCENDLSKVDELIAHYDTSVETAHDVEILYSDSAQVRVRITGPKLLYHLDQQDPRQEFPQAVQVDFFGDNQEITSILTANYGVRHERKGLVIARDSVVWRNMDGDKLETEELVWSESDKKVYSDRFVVITRPGEILYGRGLEANQDFSRWRILAPEGHILVDEEDPAEGTPPE